MPPKPMCSVEIVRNGGRRGIAFLIFQSNEAVTARTIFDTLGEKDKRWFNSIFDHWVAGGNPNDKWFHRWDQDAFKGQYTQCLVFKHRSHKHRFYGFLCHPKETDKSYEQCVLTVYANKGVWETDERSLRACEDMRCNTNVQMATKMPFNKSGKEESRNGSN